MRAERQIKIQYMRGHVIHAIPSSLKVSPPARRAEAGKWKRTDLVSYKCCKVLCVVISHTGRFEINQLPWQLFDTTYFFKHLGVQQRQPNCFLIFYIIINQNN